MPPLRLYDRGRPNDTLLAIIRRNVRIPHVVMGDLGAQVAAATVGRNRLLEVVESYGRDVVLAYMDHLLDYAEDLTRRRIAEIPDGTYRFTDYMDNDGIDLDARVPITATVTVAGSDVVVDFTGTGPQVKGPINAPWSGGAGSAYFAIRCVTDPGLPNNHGCYRPVKVVIPKGCLLNPHPPAPVAIRAHTLKRAADVVLGALAKAVPERVTGAPSGSISCVSFGGVDPATGERFGLTDIVAGGGGGRPAKDGIEAVDSDVSNCMNIPTEAVEMGYPLRVLWYRLRPDGGGAGRWRGGTGVERALQATRGEIVCSYRSERHLVSPWGFRGGLAGTRWRTEIVRATGAREAVRSKRGFTLAAGDALHVFTGGGGGYGDALERDPARVLGDVLDGKVSAAAAAEVYGVVIDRAARRVDIGATDRRRRRLGAARGPVRWLFDRGGTRETAEGEAVD